MNPLRTIVRGFGWHSGFRITTSVITAVKLAILARLLSPEIFGVYSLLLVALGLSEAATQTGINTTLLQTKKKLDRYIDTAWVIAIVRGFGIAILMIALGAALSRWYDNPDLLQYTVLAATVPVIKGFIHPAIITFYKQFRFAFDAGYKASLILIETGVTIAWALISPSVVAFIAGMIVAALFEVCLSFILLKKRPSFSFDRTIAQEIYTNAQSLLPASFMGYVAENSDNLLIGKLTSTATLGIYHNAFVLSYKPNGEMAKSVGHGSFPVYNNLINEKKPTWPIYVKTLKQSLLFFGLLSLPLFFFPELLVKILLGEGWGAVAPLLPLFGISGLLHAIAQITHPYLVAHKQYRGILVQLAVSIVVLIGGLVTIVPTHGLLGAGAVLVATRAVAALLLLWYVRFTRT